ncbi:iron-containing alcohol dehydrogenase [Colidextribacter sp. OB.20]|uniref:iron-containing alcohol dehydrogenase n=1 Tax=Colidextribacter sp. OB.20 TaxID=2304568 RepID=UPI00136EC3E8|nr:iron-containing alcohol dehydrogenase [Colidextribacter sp. OB.20]NBI11597.1 iron-containing alcohol dehydrogenase [Colidextribacter sp. OB.20]
MRSFIFENSTKVYFGQGCVEEYLSGLLDQLGGTVMLAYGGGSVKRSGVYDKIVGILKSAGRTVVDFGGIMPNPTYSKVLEGAGLARERGVTGILAVGGGSVMDCAKAVSMAAVYEGDVWADFWLKRGTVDFDPLPLGVVVTMSGTGSECNGGAVVTHEEQKIKHDRDYPRCNPRFALMDPTYTYSVPRFQMLCGGFDALSHIMEIYFSGPDEENVSDDISEALMRGVIRDLRAAARDPEDYNARSNLMWEAAMAENRIIKLNKQTDFMAHMMEHQLSAYTDCCHGAGLAVLHPVYYRAICEKGAVKFARFAVRVWGIPAEGRTEAELALAGVEALAGFIRELGLPTTLGELGIGEEVPLEEIANSVMLTDGGYGQLTREDVLSIFKACR